MLLKDLLEVIESDFVKIVFVPGNGGDHVVLFSGMIHCYNFPDSLKFERDYTVCGVIHEDVYFDHSFIDGISIVVC